MLDFVNLLCLNAVLVLYDSGDAYYEYVIVTDFATFWVIGSIDAGFDAFGDCYVGYR